MEGYLAVEVRVDETRTQGTGFVVTTELVDRQSVSARLSVYRDVALSLGEQFLLL